MAVAVSDGHIDPFLGQIAEGIGGNEPQIDTGIGRTESRQARHDPEGRESQAGAEGHAAAPLLLPGSRGGIRNRCEARRDGSLENVPFRRQAHAAPRTGKEQDAEITFQLLDLPADCGLGEAQFPAGSGEALQAAGRLEGNEGIEGR